MGMYMMRQIGTRGVYANPVLPDFMVFLNWTELPCAWWGFNWFPYAMLMVLLVPGVLAFVFGWFAFKSRVTGVYLSIITQMLTYALWLSFFRNDFGFGGNNGLTDFKDILGFSVQAQSTRAALFALSALALAGGYLIARAVVVSKLGKVLIAIRDAESRTRFLGYDVDAYKTFVFTLSAMMAGVAGALYVPQVGIINPGEFSPANSIEMVVWVAVGGRGTLVGAAVGAVVVNFLKTDVHHRLPRALLAVPARRPVHRRHAAAAEGHRRHVRRLARRPPRDSASRATTGRAARPRPVAAPSSRRNGDRSRPCPTTPRGSRARLLYLDAVEVSFDGYRALRGLSLILEPGEMRAIIGPNGAGKTTMMDVITGKTRPDTGDVLFDGRIDLTELDEAAIANLGIGRKFQKPTVFESHTVEDNILLALEGRPPRRRQPVLARQQRARPSASTRCSRPSRLTPHRRAPRRRAQPRPEAVARDRHAAGAGPEAAAGRRAGRRHDGCRDRADGASCCASIAKSHSVVVVEHDMEFVRALGCQGDRAARRRGAGRRLARPGQRQRARDRGLSGTLSVSRRQTSRSSDSGRTQA